MKVLKGKLNPESSGVLDGTDVMVLPLRFLEKEGCLLGDRVLVTAPPPYEKKELVFTIGWDIVWSGEEENRSDAISIGKGAYDRVIELFTDPDELILSRLERSPERFAVSLLVEKKPDIDPQTGVREIYQKIVAWVRENEVINSEIPYILDDGTRFVFIGDSDWGCPQLIPDVSFEIFFFVEDFDHWSDHYDKYRALLKDTKPLKEERDDITGRYKDFYSEFGARKHEIAAEVERAKAFSEIRNALKLLHDQMICSSDEDLKKNIARQRNKINSLDQLSQMITGIPEKDKDRLGVNVSGEYHRGTRFEKQLENILDVLNQKYMVSEPEEREMDGRHTEDDLDRALNGCVTNLRKVTELRPPRENVIYLPDKPDTIDSQNLRLTQYREALSKEIEEKRAEQDIANDVRENELEVIRKSVLSIQADFGQDFGESLRATRTLVREVHELESHVTAPWRNWTAEMLKELEGVGAVWKRLEESRYEEATLQEGKEGVNRIASMMEDFKNAVEEASAWLTSINIIKETEDEKEDEDF